MAAALLIKSIRPLASPSPVAAITARGDPLRFCNAVAAAGCSIAACLAGSVSLRYSSDCMILPRSEESVCSFAKAPPITVGSNPPSAAYSSSFVIWPANWPPMAASVFPNVSSSCDAFFSPAANMRCCAARNISLRYN